MTKKVGIHLLLAFNFNKAFIVQIWFDFDQSCCYRISIFFLPQFDILLANLLFKFGTKAIKASAFFRTYSSNLPEAQSERLFVTCTAININIFIKKLKKDGEFFFIEY